jgi:hypothetical protein
LHGSGSSSMGWQRMHGFDLGVDKSGTRIGPPPSSCILPQSVSFQEWPILIWILPLEEGQAVETGHFQGSSDISEISNQSRKICFYFSCRSLSKA